MNHNDRQHPFHPQRLPCPAFHCRILKSLVTLGSLFLALLLQYFQHFYCQPDWCTCNDWKESECLRYILGFLSRTREATRDVGVKIRTDGRGNESRRACVATRLTRLPALNLVGSLRVTHMLTSTQHAFLSVSFSLSGHG